MNNTLVTGANGLIGSCFKGDNFTPLHSHMCDLRDQHAVDDLFANYTDLMLMDGNPVDSVIHCAAKVGGIGANMSYKGEFFYDNIMMNTNVIESARKSGVKKLVAFLSTCIFPDGTEYPLTEKKIHDGKPHFSNDAYAYAKRMSDVQIRAYREQYGLGYISVIPTNVYGLNDNYNLENGHVIPMLIHKCYMARETGGKLEVWGDGTPMREFIFAEDLARLTEWCLDNYDDAEPIILSTSQEISISSLVGIITEKMNFKGDVIFNKDKPNGQLRKPSDNTKITNLLPDFKFTNIEDGLSKTIDYFEKNYNKVRK